MDLDDIFKILIPKSARKKLKKQLKKQSVSGILKTFLAGILALIQGRKSSSENNRSRQYKPSRQSLASAKSHAKAKDPLYEAVRQAHTYRDNIQAMALDAEPDSIRRLRLDQLLLRVTDWTEAIEQIVERATTYSEDDLLAKERKQVPQAIKRLEKQLQETSDPDLNQKLERTLDNRRRQLAHLEQVANNRRMTELKVENALTQIGIIYSQLHSGNFVAQKSSFERMSAELEQEVHGLEDYLEALRELQQGEGAWI